MDTVVSKPVSIHEKGLGLITYIKRGKKEHHKKESFEQEYRRLFDRKGIEVDEAIFFKISICFRPFRLPPHSIAWPRLRPKGHDS